jgi:beta-carotene 3-hydroxylase
MWFTSFLLSFLFMEFAAWALHKYVMHGVFWWLHEDHHKVRKGYVYQKNDFFAIVFAVPSFFFILFGNLGNIPALEGCGYGIMAYGFVYFLFHEVVIHRRWKFFDLNSWYFRAIKEAHRHHHQVNTKEGARNFGMLLPPLRYFKKQLVPSPLRKPGAV